MLVFGSLPPFVQWEIPAHEMVLPTFGLCLPTSLEMHSQAMQRCVS